MVEHGLEVPNLHCPKSYKIRNTITNFQKLNIKNEVYLTLKNNNYYTRVIIIECKNKRFAANIIHLFVEARRAETNKWFITNERSELK